MKKQSLSISIPEPCHEKWSEMSPAEKGRHCKSCQKTVIDFTRMPKVEIAEFVSQKNGSMCGRFSSDQLNVDLIPPKPTNTWFKYAAIILGLVPALGYGQEIKSAPEPIQQVEAPPITGNVSALTKGKIVAQEKSVQQDQSIKVTIMDFETKKALPTARMMLIKSKNKRKYFENNENGTFHIDFQEAAVLKVGCSGYQSQVFESIDLKGLKELNISLQKVDNMPMGMIMIDRHSQKKPKPKESKESKVIDDDPKTDRNVKGTLRCGESEEGIIFGSVAVFMNDVLQYSTDTDLEGNFQIDVPKGATIEASYIGYKTQKIEYPDIPTEGEFEISLEMAVLEEAEIVVGYYISAPKRNQESNSKNSRPIEIVNAIPTNDATKSIESIQKHISYDKNTLPKIDKNSEEEPMHYLSPAVEIIGLKPTQSKINMVGLYAVVCEERKENWLKRQWKKFKKLVNQSHEEAKENRNLTKQNLQNVLEHETNQIDTKKSAELKPKSQIAKNEYKSNPIKVKVFPNPTSGQVEIVVPTKVEKCTIHISNMNNELVLVREQTSNIVSVDLGGMAAGSYIISIISDGKLIHSEIIVKI